VVRDADVTGDGNVNGKDRRIGVLDLLSRIGVGVLLLALAHGASAGTPAQRGPNFIFILADDLGYGELSSYGNTFNETPHLDRLAHQGVRFTDAYAAAPVCSPYRAALMTGQWPARVGITDFLRPDDERHLPADQLTLAEMLQGAGYATGIIGKWHLAGYHHPEHQPPGHGFQETILSEVRRIGFGDYFHPYAFAPGVEKRLPGEEHLVDRLNLEAVDFVERHRDQPFFLFLSHYAVHTNLDGRGDLVAKYAAKPGAGSGKGARRNNPHLAAQLEAIDAGVGRILEKLDELDLADDTVVVFTSDNGGESLVTDNSPLREGKSWLYEGGIREPLILRYPRMVPERSVCDFPTSNVDFYPTFAELAGVEADPVQELDGISLVPLLEDPGARPEREALYWHYPLPRPHFLGGRSSGAIRRGDWKLIDFYDTGAVELYDLSEDRGETRNLAESLPSKAEELRRRLAEWREREKIEIPESCRDYNPEKFFWDPMVRWLLGQVLYRF
jgi:arylsulfatase A-like enzyme